MTIAITQYTRWGDCHHLRESWNSLAMSQEGTHPFQLFEWHDAWYRAYGEQRNVSVWCGTQDGQLVALLPLINSRIELGRIPYPAAVLMGGENAASDYLTSLLSPTLSDEEATKFLTHALASDCANLFVWNNIPSDSQLLRLLTTQTRYPCFKISPFHSWQANLVEGKFLLGRQSLKRPYNYFRKQPGYKVVHLTDPQEIHNELPMFFEQHIKRWSAHNATPQLMNLHHQQFYSHLSEGLGGNAKCILTKLNIDETAIAYHFGFFTPTTFYWYKPSFNSFFQNRSPGMALLAELLSFCKEQGMSTFDFTVGDEQYKKRYASISTPMVRAIIPKHFASRQFIRALHLYYRIKRAVSFRQGEIDLIQQK